MIKNKRNPGVEGSNPSGSILIYKMAEAKIGISKSGDIIHYSVGAIIKNDGKYLIIERKKFPPGFACVAGHVDKGELPEESIKREVNEESGLSVNSLRPLLEEFVPWNKCSDGIKGHHWYVFECETSGSVKQNTEETKSIGWYSEPELKNLDLEKVWKSWFTRLKIV